MEPRLPADDDTNLLFDDVVSRLVTDIGYSQAEAVALVHQYYLNFTDAKFCESIGIPVQDEDFFFHESANGIALRVHYYLKIKGDPNPRKYTEWRSSRRNK